MKQRYTTIIVLFLALCVMVPFGSAANTISANPSTVSVTQGSTRTATIMVDDLPYGLSGYHIRVSLADPSLGKIVSVSYPQWAVLNMTDGLQSASVSMSAVDLTNQVVAGAKAVEIGSITIMGDSSGSTNILITTLKFDGDGESGVDMGRTTVQTTQPTVTATPSVQSTTGSMSYSGGGGGSSGSSSSGTSGSSGSGSSVPTTKVQTTTVPSVQGTVPPRGTVVIPSQSSTTESAAGIVTSTTAVPPAVPVTSGGIPGWVLAGIGIITVLAAGSLIYLTYKKKL
jgi:uncharacterized membrane protein YgcG